MCEGGGSWGGGEVPHASQGAATSVCALSCVSVCEHAWCVPACVHVCACVCVRAYLCVRACVCVWRGEGVHAHAHTSVSVWAYGC